MALSGSASGTKKGGWQITMSWSATQNITANTSAISWQVKLVADSAWRINSGSFNGSITIGGKTTGFSKNPSTNGGATILLGSGTTTVSHNSDGSKSCGISFTYNLGIYSNSLGGTVGALSGSTTASLNKIARASTFITNTATVEMGGNLTVLITAANAAFTHKLNFTFGSFHGVMVDKPETGHNINVHFPLATFAPIIYNNTTGWGGLTLDTYNGATKIGTATRKLTLTVPASVVPTINSVALTDTSTVPSKLGVEPEDGLFVDGVSTLHFGVAAGGAYGSTIKQYNFTVDGKTYTSNSATYDLPSSIGTGAKSVTVGVIDTRGRKASKTVAVNVTPYSSIALGAFTALRNKTTQNQVDVAKTVTASPLKSGATDLNSFTVKTEYKATTATTWSLAKTENNIKTSTVAIAGVDVTKSYDLRVTAADKLTTATLIVSISTSKVLLDLDRDKGVGIGKMHESGVLDVGGDSHFEGNIFVNGKTLLNMFYPIGTIYESVNSENPSSFMGGTWERFGNGKVLVGVDEGDAVIATAGAEGGSVNPLSEHKHKQIFSNSATAILANIGSARSPLSNYLDKTGEGAAITSAGDNTNHANWQPYITVYRWRRTA